MLDVPAAAAAQARQVGTDSNLSPSGTGSQPEAVQTPPQPQAPPRLSGARRRAAVAALTRFADKLSGRDDELTRGGRHALGAAGGVESASGVDEQVSALLRAAMSIDNLSRMYEGWTPWL